MIPTFTSMAATTCLPETTGSLGMGNLNCCPDLLDLEVKDVPFLVVAFQHKAILVSDNIRSLVNKRSGIQTLSRDEILAIMDGK
ncbi:MAG: hypothetical protein ACXACI_15615 [Candidatus Hodarchaeales archaeon]